MVREIEGLALLVIDQLYVQHTGSKYSVMTICWFLCAPDGWTEHKEIKLLPNDAELNLNKISSVKENN